MMRVNSVHSLLDNKNWDVEDLRKHLETDSATVNEISPFRDSPLVRVLKSDKCSLDVVRLLLDHGASANCNSSNRHSPLTVAVRSLRCNAVLGELLGRGADARVLDKNGQSCICVALQANAPENVLRLLLEAGCSPNACQHHVSVLHCASFRPGLESEVLEMFLNAGADIHQFGRWGRQGQSPLCFALRGGVDGQGVRLLLKRGMKLDACTRHASSLLCATENVWGARLRADLVYALLNAGAATGRTNEDGWAPLQLALRYCKYEEGAVKALLDIPGTDVNGTTVGWRDDTLLHLAVENSHCKPSVVRLLLSRGARVDKKNYYDEIPLHLALMNEECHTGVVALLLESGSLVNTGNKHGKSPLQIAFERERSCDVLHLLLAAGAKIGIVKHLMDRSLLKLVWDKFEEKRYRDSLDRLKLVATYSFLEDPDFMVEYMSPRWRKYDFMMRFSERCVAEIKMMALKDVGNGLTLKQFLTRPSHENPESNNYDFCKLFKILSDNKFPNYFDAISAKIGRTLLKGLLGELEVFAVKESFGFSRIEQKIFLNYECLCVLIKYLPLPDKLRLVLAFYVSHERCLAEDSRIGGKRNHDLFFGFGGAAWVASFLLGIMVTSIITTIMLVLRVFDDHKLLKYKI